jgi:ammonium transporter, Amt family
MQFFKEQVTTEMYLLDVFYLMASATLILLVGAIGLIDAGLVRRKNVLETWIGKLVSALVAGGAFTVIGYGIWNWQYFTMAGVPNPLGESIKAWWLGGTNLTTYAQNLNPEAVYEADVFQVFFVFFIAYAAVVGALLHSAGLERVKAAPMFIMCAIAGGLIMPILAYLTWGSASWLTRNGTHDYMGVFSLYLLVGVWSLILVWRVGPRLGAFTPHPGTRGPIPHNLGLSAAGVGLILFAVPFLALGCGFIVPETGYFGVSMTTSGFGIAASNIFVAFCGGAISGAIIAYITKNPITALLGPVTGYIAGGASADIVHPWLMFLIAAGGPVCFYATYRLMLRLRLDDKKIVPLTLGTGLYGALIPGIVKWGTPTGGFFGITEGPYAFQGAEINLWWQAIGVAVVVGIAAVSGLIVIIGLEKTIGLRVKEDIELLGLDESIWSVPPEPNVDGPPHEVVSGYPGDAGSREQTPGATATAMTASPPPPRMGPGGRTQLP